MLHPSNNDVITVTHKDESNIFESLIGLEKDTVHASGTPFNTGGLYLFDVEIISTQYGTPDTPISFSAGTIHPTKDITHD